MTRTPIELVMFAAWIGVDPENIPEQYRGHLCADTMARWRRVGEAAVEYARGEALGEVQRVVGDLSHLMYIGIQDGDITVTEDCNFIDASAAFEAVNAAIASLAEPHQKARAISDTGRGG